MKSLVVFLSVVAVTYGNLHAKVKDQELTVGSQPIEQRFPYEVTIERRNGRVVCRGSLLKPNVVLTAAHCKKSTLFVRARDLDIQRIKVKKWIKHPSFMKPLYDNNVAIVILKDNFTLDTDIQTISLERSKLPKPGAMLTVTGWEKPHRKGNVSDTLLYTTLPMVAKDTCREYYKEKITDNVFCAGYPEEQLMECKGDAGGPAVYRGKQVGIVSWQYGCTSTKRNTLFTDVTRYTEWIKENINGD